ncbi:MAG: aminotransferase class V-fold PLP-dependent enzyme [Actinomycetaceae bacterium]|nr:aminotransferase class V-fold PLP-dependent enzyme [Actinomycetaceae bacterium]
MTYQFDTLQIHAGYEQPDPVTGSRAVPIYQTSAYVFDDAEQAANRFALTEGGPIYSRLGNPTVSVVEDKITALEGGTAGIVLSSGQAAIFYAVVTAASAGDHIVASHSLYGGTANLFRNTLPKLGITCTFIKDPHDLDEWQAAVQDNTKLFYGETIPNPKGDILDIEPIAEIAHNNGIPLIVDSTVATPYLLRPFDYGADIVIHSMTKFLGGHGTTLGGAIIENGKFNWKNGKFPAFHEPDTSYNGVVFGDLGGGAFTARVRTTILRDTGAALSALDAWILNLGIETLSLRMERHVKNALEVAKFTQTQPGVACVHYASLPSSADYALAQKYLPKGAGSVLSFDLVGGREIGQKFVDALELHSNVANIGDVRSLVIHPASTTQSQLSEEQLQQAGITGGTVRLSVGLEDVEDIINDLKKGFAAIR